ncbi:MAG: TonB-dependent receptor [Prevotellaceae bacterium]|nr:TonB-dependent receptor [Prevotellaceae bacterium]
MSLLALLFFSIGIATAQTVTVKGVVISEEDGQPIIGASVVVVGTNIGAATNADGQFTLSEVPSTAKTLRVSYIGMATQDVAIRPNVRVILTSDSELIDEVVVTGYGSQKKASFTGAASIVNNEAITKKSDANFMKSLEGTMAGIQMDNSTGMPGAWASVYIRGRGSLNSGTQPLYVIDGMPMNSDYDGMSSSSNNYVDPMTSINAADIETVTVLKDASATAIYGSRASNGVIVITTKKGKQGRFELNLDVKQGFSIMGNNNLKYANSQQTMNLFTKGTILSQPEDERLSYDDEYKALTSRFGWDGKRSTDWIDLVTRKAYYQDYNLNGQGRVGDTGYFFSVGYLNSKGLVINSDMERFTGRLNLDTKFKVFTVGVNTSFSYSTSNAFSQSTGGAMSSAITSAKSNMLPMYAPYNDDGSYTNIGSYNPLAVYDKDKGDIYRSTNQVVNLNPYLQVDFGLGIYAKSTLGVNLTDFREYDYWGALYNPQGMNYNGLGQQYNSRRSVITWNNIIGWNYTFNKKHNINLMLGQEMQKKYYHYEYYAGSDFPFADSGMRDLATAGSWEDSEYLWNKARLASYFVDAHYSYDDKYYLSASFRRDGSSVFGSEHRWGNFGSVGAKWRLTGEEFLKDNKIITNAAIRASYGTVGNQDLGDSEWYAARGFYSAGYNYNSSPGMVPTSVPNPKLTWEATEKFDVGFDLSFINRLHFTFDFYNETTKDALFRVPMSMVVGLDDAFQNIGRIRNRGIEFAVNATPIHNHELIWDVYANVTWNQNRVIKLSTGEPIETSTTIIEEGRPYRQFKMKEYAGVDPSNGKPMWYLNETGDETTYDYNAAAKRYVGSAEPKVFGGFGTKLTWKGFDFNLAFNYRLGGKVYDSGASFTGFGMNAYRTPLEDVALNSWTPQNPNAKYPEWIFGDPNKASSASSRFVYNGSFLRISNAMLGYTLPSYLTKKAYIQKLRVYVSGDNLYTFTAGDFVGYNPETYTSGVIAWQYPTSTTLTAGIQITF